MVSVVAGKGVGLVRSSAWVLGAEGQFGSASLGRGSDNVYVNGANGNLVITRRDEFLIGRGPDISIDRTYNSQGDLSDDNGDNWRMGVYRKVTGLTGAYGATNSTVKRIDWDGSDTLYKWNAAQAAYIATDGAGAYDKLTRTGTTWTWTDGDSRTTELYDGNQGGRITTTTDIDGNSLTYAYDGSGLITRVTSNNGSGTGDDEWTDLVYVGNKLQKVTTSSASGLTRVFYEYDTAGRLWKVKVNLDPADNSATTGTNYVTTYSYVDSTSKRVSSITQTDGSSLTIGYTLLGGVYKVSTLTQVSSQGVNRTTWIGYFSDRAYVTRDGGGTTTICFYPSSGEAWALSDGTEQTSFNYNSNGDVTYVSRGPFNSVSREYDSRGNRTTEVDSLGNTVKRTYDSKNQLLTETRFAAPDPDGMYGPAQPGSPLTTRYAYDSVGHLRYVVSPEGRVTEYVTETNAAMLGYGKRVAEIHYGELAYDVSGLAYNDDIEVNELDDWLENADRSAAVRTQTEYDFRGNITAVKSYSRLLASGQFDTSSELSHTIYTYDQAGNLLTRQVAGSSGSEVFAYDGLNRVVASTDFNNAQTNVAFYDSTSTTIVSHANGLVATSLYNLAGELITYTESGPEVTSAVTNYRYDSIGRLKVTIDALGRRDYFFYDLKNRRTAEIDSDGSMIEYRYDLSGNLTSTTRYATKLSSGTLASLADANGNPNPVDLYAIRPGQHADDRWTWHMYDDAQRLVRTIDAAGSTSVFAYDGASRLLSTRHYANRISAGELAILKASPASINNSPTRGAGNNVWGSEAADWFYENCDWGYSAPIDGNPAFAFMATTWYDPAAIEFSDPVYANELTVVTTELTMKGVQAYENSHQFGFYNPEEPDDWSGATTAIIVSGPGNLWRTSEGHWQITGLSNTQATRVRLVRSLNAGEATQFRFFIRYRDPSADEEGVLYKSVILSNPYFSATSYFPPALPAETGADRLVRSFHDNDDRLIGTLDADGYLTEILYDKTGRKTKSIAYSGATEASLRATGSFSQLKSSITIDNAKDIHTYCVYDARGMLRAEIDGEGSVTRYAYTPLGHVSEMVTGQKLDPADLLTAPPTFATLPDAPPEAVLETTAYTRNLYGQILTETKSLTGSTSTVTTYAYDNMRQLVSTTTQSGGPDARTESRRYDLRGRLKTEMSGIGSAMLAALGPNPDPEVAEPIWAEYGTFFGYDAADRLVAISDAVGARTVFYYDADDRLAYQVDAVGAVVEYRYNSLGDRTDAIVYAARIDSENLWELVGGDAAGIAALVTTLADASLDQTSHFEFNADGTIKQATDPLGALTTYAYNAFGELVVQSDPFNTGTVIQTSFAYNRRGQVTTRIVDSAAGGKAIATSYGYDAFGREIILTNPNNHIIATDYDRAGRVLSTTDALDNTTEFTYDARGNQVAVTDALGHVTRYVYDNAGRRIFAVDALGGVVETSYDGDGRVLATRAYANAVSTAGWGLEIAAGDVTAQLTASSSDRITRNAHDKDGRLKFVVDGAGGLTEYRYDDVGNSVRTIRYDWTVSPASTYTLDDLQAEVDAHEADPKRITRAVYDPAGRMTFAIDATGNVTAFTYDSVGRITKQVAFVAAYDTGEDPIEGVIQQWADANGHADDRVSRAVYDRRGRLAYSIDAESFVTEYRYSKRDAVVKEIRYADPYTVGDGATVASLAAQIGSLPPSALVTDMVYDSAGRLTETIDALDHRTVMTLDQLGQILSTTVAYGTADAATTTRSYDALGRVETETRADGTAVETTTAYGYDVLGALVSITRAVGTAAEWVTLRRYDVLGRLHSEMSGIGSAMVAALGPNPDQELVDPIWAEYGTFYGYDEAGRLIATSNAVGARALFYYDKADRLAYQVDALGAVVEHRYNALGDREETIRYAARIDNETLWELVGGDSSDVAGIVAALADAPLDEKTVATYDAAGRLSLNSGQLGAYTAYAYDSFGAVKLRSVALGESGTPGVATEVRTSFDYDRRGLLTSEIVDSAAGGKAITTGYEYDAFGRAFETTDANDYVTATVYDRAGRVLSRTDALDNTTFFTYDARGNLVAVTDALGHVTRYVYDNADRRIFAVDALGGVVATSYDGDGRVVATRAYADEISLVGFGLQITADDVTLQLTTDAGDRITRNAHDKDGRLRFVVDGAGGLTEYRYDDVGNAIRTIRYDWTVSPASTYTLDDLQAQVDAHPGVPGRTMRSVYDAAGRMTFAIDATGNVTAFTYDSAGRAIKQVLFATAYAQSDDPLDPVMQGWASASAHADDRISRSIYDRQGRRAYSVDAESYVTEYRHDRAGNVILEIRYADPYAIADGATPASLAALLPSSIPQSAVTTEFVYDSAGRLEGTRDGLDILTQMTLDQLGQILSTTLAHGTVDAVTTTREYDALGRLITESRADGTPEEVTTAYGYNALGDLISITHAVGTPAEWMTMRRYNALGNLHSELSGIGSAMVAALGPNPDEEVVDPIWAEYGTFYGYDAAGRQIATSDANGSRTLYYYDADGRLTYQVDELGAVVEYRYDGLGERSETIAYAARINNETLWEMTGGTAGDADAIVAALADAPLDEKTVATYDAAGRLTLMSGQLGAYTAYTYDSFGAVKLRSVALGESGTPGVATEVRTSFDYDRRGLLTSEIVDSAAGGKAITTGYEYDAFGRAFETTDANDYVTATVYDRAGRVLSRTDALDNTTFFTYDARGNLVAIKDALNHITRYVYDNADRRIFAVDALGGVVATSYDGDGRVVATRAYADEISLVGFGLQIAADDVTLQLTTDAGDRITRNAHDKDGRLRFVVDGAGGLTEYRYDDVGNAIRTIRHDWTVSPASTYTLDDLQAEVDAHPGVPGRTMRSVYDAAGRMTFAIDATGNVTAFTYDSAGRATKQVLFATAYAQSDDPLDPVMQGWAAASAHADDRISRSIYDRQGRLAYSVDAESYVTEYRYNRAGNVTLEIRYADPYAVGDGATVASLAAQIGSLPASALVTDMVYDSAGRATETIDALDHRTVMTLDQLGQILSTTVAYGTADAATTTRSYDALGRVETEIRADGTPAETMTAYGYNALGELISIARAVGTSAEWTTTRNYDGLGRLQRELSGIGSALLAALGPNPDQGQADSIWAEYGTHFSYDTASRLIARSDATGARTLFYYDAADRLAYLVDGVGAVVEHRYNALGDHVETVLYATRIDTETFSELTGGPAADVAGIVTALADASRDEKTVATYDAAGRMSLNSGQLGSYTAYTYNSFGEVELRKVALGESATPGVATEIGTSFSYDRRGKLETAIVDSAAGGKAITTHHGYDPFGREITLTDANNHSTATDYDRAGRVVSMTDALNNTTFFTYDARGNLVAIKDALNHITRYVYDNADRRIFSVGALGGVVETSYDGDGRVLATRAYADAISLAGFGLQITAADVTTQLSLASTDRITRSAYDKDGRLRFLVEGSSLTEHRYDDVGNAIRTIRYGWTVSPASTYTIDDLRAQVEAHDAVGDPKRVERSVHDMAGRVAFAIDGAGSVTRFTYDSAGRVIKQAALATAYLGSGDPVEAVMQQWADANAHADDRISRAIHDRQGRLVYSVDAKGFVTEYRYSRAGEVTEQIRYRDAYVIGDSDTPESIESLLPGLQDAVVTTFSHDSAGRLDRIQDAAGNVTTMVLDDLGQAISTTVTASGTSETSTTQRSYDELGRLETETRGHGTDEQVTTRYGYNAFGQVTSITYADGTADPCTTTRIYDEVGRLESETRADGHPEEVTTAYTYTVFGDVETIAYAAATTDESVTVRYYDVRGRVEHEMKGYWGGPLTNTVYTYNAFGEIHTVAEGAYLPDESVTARTYDGRGNLETETRASGTGDATTTRFGYNRFGEIESVTGAYGTADAAVTTHIHDALGRVVSIRQQVDDQPANDLVTAHEYDGFDNLVKVTDPRLSSVFYYYDKLGRVELQIDQEGYVTETTYHALHGEPETVTLYATRLTGPFDVDERPLVPTDPRDATTQFDYDELGRLTGVTDAEDHGETYELDIHGNRIKLTNKLGGETDYTYDKLGRVKTQFVHADVHDQEGGLQAAGIRTDFDYDKRGNLITQTEGANLASSEARTIQYKYDQMDRLIEIDREDLASLQGLTGNITLTMKDSFLYDRRGNLIEEKLAGGPTRNIYYYDKLDRRILEVGPLGRLTEWDYDANGNVTGHRIYADLVEVPAVAWAAPPNPVDPNDFRETRFSYDKANRLETTRGPELTAGGWNGTAYVFETGEIVQEVDYDAAGNIIRQGVGDVATRSFYDKASRKIGELDAEGYLTVFDLDAEGNTLKETRYATRPAGTVPQATASDQLHAAAAATVSADDRITEFSYDLNGRRRSEMRRDVEAWTVTGIGGTLGQDNAPGHVHSKIEYEYNGFGQVVRRIEANGDDTVYEYDDQGRLMRTIGETFVDQNGVAVAPTTEHRYDGFGSIVRTVENPASANARITRYVYNGMGWLEHVTDAEGGTHSYVHDGAGKVVADKYSRTKSDGTTTTNEAISYHYDEYSRLTSRSLATQTSGGPNPTYSFGDITRFKYNIYGDMTGRGINTGENGIIYQESFDYDAGGRLWRTNEGGSSKILFYDKNGNATLALSSTGADVGALTFEQAKSSIVNASITGDTNIAGAVTTIAVFDKRGQQVATLEPDREFIADGAHLTIGSARFYNAFGEVVSEIDPRGYMPGADPNAFRTDFIYNRMGRLVEKRSPQVSWTDQFGTLAAARPTEFYRHDVAGRMIAVVDANGFTTRRSLLAGTGHAGTEALVTVQYHPDDQNKAQTFYDVFGDARIQRNEYWQNAGSDLTKTDVNMEYDRLGRLVEVEHLGRRLTETFAYDQLGQRIRHNFIHDQAQQFTEYTDYDRQGRVTDHVAVGGDLTHYTYVWESTLDTQIVGSPGGPVNLGGWVKTTLHAGGRDATETIDYFDRTIARSDLADNPNTYTYTFDYAGRLASQTVGGETLSYSYLNTSRLGSVSKGAGNSTAYGYDAAGNETSEVTHRGGALVQNATATYDALGRMIGWAEAGTTTLPAASVSIEYDRVGNIRRRKALFQRLNGTGSPNGTNPAQDNWYLYDKLNRVTTDRGFLVALDGQGGIITGDAARGIGTIRRQVPGAVLPQLHIPGEVGADYAYDEAGRRVSMAVTKVRFEGGPIPNASYFREHKEMYDYFADGSLWQVRNADGAEVFANLSTYSAPPASGPGTLRSTFARDALGRVTSQTDWVSAGVSVYSRTGIVYNGMGQITDETVSTRANEGGQNITYVTTIDNQYGTGLGYALGSVTSSTATTTRQNAAHSTATTTNTFNWRDGPVMATTRIVTDRVQGTDTDHTTTYNYNASGELTSVGIQDGRPRTVFLTNDMAGQIMRRDETGGTSSGQPHDLWYRFGGREMGHVSNNSTLDVDYESSVVYRQIWLGDSNAQGAFRFGANTPTHYADFSKSMELVNSYEQGSAGGAYVVQAGDTLQSIAFALWGNGDLWYKLAEANGLGAAGQLVEGQSLTIPIGVLSNAHNASTFKPYDSAKALGDLSPSTPKPPKKPGGCGMLGQFIVAAIAIAVTLIIKVPVANFIMGLATSAGATAATAAAITAVAGAAVTAGVASAVSQGIGVATGLTEKFSWKGVALSALSAGVGAGISQLPGGVGAFLAKDTLISNIAQATSAKAVTEGIAVAVGLKKSFDWAGIASAGVAAAVGGIVSRSLPGRAGFDANGNATPPSYENAQLSGMASILAGAGTRALVTGTSFGDNIASALPDILTMTIGNAIAYGRFRGGGEQAVEEPAPAAAPPPVDPAPTRNILTDGFELEPIRLEISPELQALLDQFALIDALATSGARGSAATLRETIRTASPERQGEWRAALVEGGTSIVPPLPEGSTIPVIPRIGPYGGGPAIGRQPLAGYINENYYFYEGGEENLRGYMYAAGFDGSEGAIGALTERIDLETRGHTRMMEGNIVAFRATGDGPLLRVADRLEAIRQDRWVNGESQAAALADAEVMNLLSVAAIGPKVGFSLVGAIPNAIVTTGDIILNDTPPEEALLSILPLAQQISQANRLRRQVGQIDNSLDDLARSSGSINQRPYDGPGMRDMLESRYPGQVTSSTVPRRSDPGVANARGRDPDTRIPFDTRGFPIFDDVAAFDTRIPARSIAIQDRRSHMRAATRQLREAIDRGAASADNFNPAQLAAIRSGSSKIPGYTWHHHQDRGRMQLVPSQFHDPTRHTGGFSLWYPR